MYTVNQRSPYELGKVTVLTGSSGLSPEQEIALARRRSPTRHTIARSKNAPLQRQRVMLLVVDPRAAITRQLVDFRLRYKDVRLAMDNFNLFIVDVANEQATQFLRSLELHPLPQIVVRTSEGRRSPRPRWPMFRSMARSTALGSSIGCVPMARKCPTHKIFSTTRWPMPDSRAGGCSCSRRPFGAVLATCWPRFSNRSAPFWKKITFGFKSTNAGPINKRPLIAFGQRATVSGFPGWPPSTPMAEGSPCCRAIPAPIRFTIYSRRHPSD